MYINYLKGVIMQEKNKTIPKTLPETMNSHIFKYYRTHGLRGFCILHGINYFSGSKVYNGSKEYPGVEKKILEAIGKDESGIIKESSNELEKAGVNA